MSEAYCRLSNVRSIGGVELKMCFDMVFARKRKQNASNECDETDEWNEAEQNGRSDLDIYTYQSEQKGALVIAK